MTKQLCILIILTFQTTFSFACLNTYQFKIFPVGVSQDKIITVDVQIRRTSQVEGNRWLNLGLEKTDEWSEMWILYSYVSAYDKNQKLISLTPLDTTYSIGKNYSDTLDKAYQNGLKKIANEFTDLEYFRPDYISFCDFQQKCNIVKIQSDTLSSKDFVIYEGKKYQTDIVRDTSYYGFGRSPYHPETITGLYINSVRVYKTKTLTLLVTHLVTGHEISMGWITSDPKKAGKTEDGEISLAKEHKPNLTFTDLKKSTYEEPLLHHGYGFDIFIIK
jgi:hypothetical protein